MNRHRREAQDRHPSGFPVRSGPAVCAPCSGRGVILTASPIRRVTAAGAPLTLLIQCAACEGHGIVTPARDRNFALIP